jgi:hypothetical protein
MITSTRGYGWLSEGHMARVTTNDDDSLLRERYSDVARGCAQTRSPEIGT